MQIKMSVNEIMDHMIQAASKFTAVLLSAGVDDDEAAARGSEIAIEMFKRVSYNIAEIISENEEDTSEVVLYEEDEV